MPGLRDILDAAASGGPWHFNEVNHLLVSHEPDRVGFIDNLEDGRLAALAPELAAWGLDVFERHAHLLDDDLLNRWQEITGGE